MEGREPELRLFDSSEELDSCLADYVYQISESAVNERGSFSLVISGGDMANRLGKLTRPPFLKTVDWSKWHVFWAEENVVPDKRHPDSFYRQAAEAFISKVPIMPTHVVSVRHGVPGESAANGYEFSIRQQVRRRTVPVSPFSDCPRFDLVLLNLGNNCHVASLYPNHPVLEEDSQWVACVSSDASRESVTLTLPVINAAANVAIVASGNDVARSFSHVMMEPKADEPYPAQLVGPKDGKLVWFVDAAAASLFLHGHGTSAT
ncbi:hypothetical protein Pint_08243 [Pistacia integerrima]|uniref:Uncharacterized protein n=1 Tax=Pistacia integerrima TaxID=434235 RepID=A0ACC0XZA4_9ROSI|nr:hypothetical protein Pint_08243 [Pistacia integerrima]